MPRRAREEAPATAAGRLQHLTDAGKVTIHRQGRDKYGRTLADVFVGRENVAEVLIREGVATPYDGRSKRVFWVQRLCGVGAPQAGAEQGYLQ